MSNARPSLAAKTSKKSEADRKAALDQGLRLTVDGNAYEVRLGDVTPSLARELRNATGMGFMQLIGGITGPAADIDLISAFVWVARRIRGEYVDIDDVEVSYAQMLSDGFDVAVAGEEQEPEDLPEG